MGTQRINLAAALVALTLLSQAAPASASSTLLSGYGGPGAGNQVILGSTLVGGGAGNGGGRGTSGAPSSSSSFSPSSIALPQTAPAPVRGAPSRQVPTHHRTKPSGSRHAAKPAAPAYTLAIPTADRTVGGKALGLTGDDVVYIVLALGALALTAFLTTRLARRADRTEGTQ